MISFFNLLNRYGFIVSLKTHAHLYAVSTCETKTCDNGKQTITELWMKSCNNFKLTEKNPEWDKKSFKYEVLDQEGAALNE